MLRCYCYIATHATFANLHLLLHLLVLLLLKSTFRLHNLMAHRSSTIRSTLHNVYKTV